MDDLQSEPEIDAFARKILFQKVKLDYISLVNLIMDAPVVKELIQKDFNKKNLKSELISTGFSTGWAIGCFDLTTLSELFFWRFLVVTTRDFLLPHEIKTVVGIVNIKHNSIVLTKLPAIWLFRFRESENLKTILLIDRFINKICCDLASSYST